MLGKKVTGNTRENVARSSMKGVSMSKQPRLPKLLWHKLERYGVVSLFLFMVFCLFFAVVVALLGVPKVAGALMSVAGVALFVMLFIKNGEK